MRSRFLAAINSSTLLQSALLSCRPMLLSAPLRILSLALAAATLAGCGSGGTLPTGPVPTPPGSTYSGAAFSGTVLAGTTPLSGASVQLFAVGSTGNGSGATALLSSTLTTDSSGDFNVGAGYTCATANAQLYLVARGGALPPQAPATTSTANPAIVLLAPIGACSGIATGAHIPVSELTTAASAWALSPFLAPDGTVGASSTNTAGLTNALTTALNLQSSATAAAPPAAYTNAVLRVRSMANLLHTCAVLTPASACSSLFAATATGAAPTDTLAAALNLVRNPGQNVAALYAQSALSTVFTPALAAAPADWTLFLSYTGGGMNGPTAVAVDSAGNVWVTSFFGVASVFSPTGDPAFPSGITGSGLGSSYGLALDSQDNAWIPNREGGTANNGIGTVTELSSAGQPLSGTTGYASGGLNYPIALAISPTGSTWVVDYGNSHLTVLSNSGQPLSGTSGYASDLFAFPVAIALGTTGDAWVANQGGTTITHVSADGQTFTNSNCCNGASGLAIDAGGTVWVADYYGNSISRVSSTGAVLASALTGGGIDQPQAVAIDGSGAVWVANYHGNTLSELAASSATSPGQALSPAAGWLTDADLSEPSGLAIDASGDLWISNFGTDTLTEVIGLATPVKTPLIGPVQLP